MKAKQIILSTIPRGKPTQSTFGVEEINIRDLEQGEVLLQPLYISVDPYMRGLMSEVKLYATAFGPGSPIVGGVVAEVKESKSPEFKKEDKVLGMLPWATLAIAGEQELQKVDPSVPLSYHLGVTGMTGLAAYFGVTDICKPKQGETFVVSAAAGAVGTVVAQIAKIKGCRVVGIAGSAEKVKLLKEKYKLDEVINYKTEDLPKAIAKACPKGVDCYFDNVGGKISDAVFNNLNQYARVAVCGQISLYNATEALIGPRLLPTIMITSSLVKGFLVGDYMPRFAEGATQLIEWIKEGKLESAETIMEGFDNLPKAFMGLFEGRNTGKMVVKI